jgi:hypothetical protein
LQHNKSVLLKGKSTSSAVKWTSSGWGSFSNQASPETEYQFLETDKSGVLSLYLSSNDACGKTSDQVNIFWVKGPEIAFSDVPSAEVCSNDIIYFKAVATMPYKFTATATGSVDSSKSVSEGKVTYFFNYRPSKADSAAGKVVFRLQGAGNEVCPARDSAVIKFYMFSVDAGPDLTVCNNGYYAAIPLTGSASGSANYPHWFIKNATGKFSITENSASNYYLPGSIDTLMGKIELRFEAYGKCGADDDIKIINFVPSPKVMATTHSSRWDTIACPGQPFPLQGKMSGAAGVLWIAAGTGYFSPNATSLNTTYIPSELDLMKGSFGVQIRTTGNNACQAQDTLSARFIIPTSVHAGPDLFVPADQAGIQLHGSSNESPAFYYWTTTGTGTFSSVTVSDPVYFPTAQDIANGSVVMTLGSIVDNPCDFKDEMRVTFVNPSPASISGSILLEDKSKAEGAKVALFQEKNGSYYEIESFISSNGDFSFSGKPVGKYLIYATPQNTLSNTYIPTYSGNVKEWTDAKPITLGSKNISGSITLLPYVKSTDFTGFDNIAGTVTFDDLKLRVSGSGGEPVEGATVYLTDGKGNELGYTSTNEFGMFLFINVEKGNYQLKYEYPGVKPLSLTAAVDGDPTTLSSGSASLERDMIVTSVNDAAENNLKILVVPNPASEYVQINTGISDSYEYTVFNSAGIVEMEGKVDNGEDKVYLESLTTGLYVIKIIQNDNVLNAKILKK